MTMKKAGLLLIFATFAVNFLNFAFNALLGRHLSFEEFGFVTLINTFYYLLAIPLSAVSTTVNHRVAFLFAKNEGDKETLFFRQTTIRLLILTLFALLFWLIISPGVAKFFQIKQVETVIFFTPAIFFGMLSSLNLGLLKGRLLFVYAALIILVEAFSKLAVAVFLILIKREELIYLSIPFSIAASGVVSAFFVKSQLFFKIESGVEKYHFPKKFFTAAFVSNLAGTLFFSLDVIFAKHYLSIRVAGQYALLSLIGKMIYFFSSVPNQFTLTLVARDEGLMKNPARIFHKIFFTTFATIAVK